jgi:hypothetical protein
MGVRKDAYRILVGKPKGKSPLGRSKRRWDNNIKWIFKNLNGGIG